MTKCLFTNDDCKQNPFDVGISSTCWEYSCPTCGPYIVSSVVLDIFAVGGARTAGQLKINCAFQSLTKNQEGSKIIVFFLTKNDMETYKNLNQYSNYRFVILEDLEDMEDEYVDHAEKPFVLLECAANRLGKIASFAYYQIDKKDLVLAKIDSDTELRYVLNHLLEKKLISSGKFSRTIPEELNEIMLAKSFIFTIDGWAFVREKHTEINSNRVFVAMRFEWPGTFKTVGQSALESIRKACRSTGYEANIVGQNHTGYITDQIIADIKQSKFVVAEYTFQNRGVYYEAGFAKGLGKPVFHLVHEDHIDGTEENKKFHFDIKQINYRSWKTPDELEEKLSSWISASIGQYGKSK
jgi:hypothetical protein